ncbi:uncharacterized protein CXorf38 homolog [Sebastes fasciatus]|uniref:uncharacterized protein CXorf38 homolog n=1 Tax=Sebastes fasciatus TaxID=394691 RepID=UPI003D9E024F
MESVREFNEDPKNQNWLKGVVVLGNFQKLIESFTDEEIEKFHGELGNQCGPDHCVKKCDLKNWNPRTNQSPPLDCEVCSRWRDVILTNHTSQHGKVMWSNSKPHLWSREKWEVAKVYMPGGHKNHNSVGDFDIAALLCLMRQCKYFKKFELGGLCDKVSNVRNKIMHAPRYQLEQKDLQDYFNQIRELGEKLARHDPKFKSLSEDIDEMLNLDYRLILPDDIAAQENLKSQREKDLEDLLYVRHTKLTLKFALFWNMLSFFNHANSIYICFIYILGCCSGNQEHSGGAGETRF